MMKQNKEHKNRPTCVTPSSKKLESPLDAKKKILCNSTQSIKTKQIFCKFLSIK